MNPPKINYLQTTEGAVSFDRITTEPPPNFQLRVGHHLLDARNFSRQVHASCALTRLVAQRDDDIRTALRP
jgi:hypothetical protein